MHKIFLLGLLLVGFTESIKMLKRDQHRQLELHKLQNLDDIGLENESSQNLPTNEKKEPVNAEIKKDLKKPQAQNKFGRAKNPQREQKGQKRNERDNGGNRKNGGDGVKLKNDKKINEQSNGKIKRQGNSKGSRQEQGKAKRQTNVQGNGLRKGQSGQTV